MKRCLYVFLMIAFLGCTPERETREIVGFDSEEFDSEEQRLRMQQYMEAKTSCYDNLSTYKASDEFEFIKPLVYKRITDSVHFYITCNYDGTVLFNQFHESVDIESLEDKVFFWIDKNRVYYERSTSSGMGIYRLEGADRKTFKVFKNTVFGKDKFHVYSSVSGILEGVDIETFEPEIFKDASSQAGNAY
ncbi:MAG: hypothetical protein ACI81T_003238 [Bacteroidia bacterium]|jgi:hypothetical protein